MDDDDRVEAERQRRIADACTGRDGEVTATGRLGLYRRLVQGNLAAVARRLIPRTAAALDAAGSAYAGWFARFLAEAGPRTPYLRDVPVEMVSWALPLWTERAAAAELPASLPDLARHEIDLFVVESTPRDAAPATVGEVSVERPLVFATPRRLVRYEHAVHRPAEVASATLTAAPTWLLMHRDEDNTVHALVVEPRWADLLGRLLEGATLGEALKQSNMPTPKGESPTDTERALAEWLASLGAHGALLGGLG